MDDIDKIVQAMVEDKLNLMNYLIQHWIFKSYNPKANSWVVSFNIDDEEIMARLDKYLNGGHEKCLK